MREFHVSMRDLCIRYKGTFSGRNGRFISPIASLHESPRAATRRLDNTRVLCHRLESTPRLPAPAACTPLETNQYNHTNTHTWYRIMFGFLFLAPYARTTRCEEAFFSLGKPRKKRLASLARLIIKKNASKKLRLGLHRKIRNSV